MKWPYARLWALLATAFAVIMLLSTFDDLRIFGHQMAKVKTSPEVGGQAVRSVAVSEKNVAATDTCKYTLLFVGDSMLGIVTASGCLCRRKRAFALHCDLVWVDNRKMGCDT